MQNNRPLVFRFGLLIASVSIILACTRINPIGSGCDGFIDALGTVSPEIENQVQTAITSAGLDGAALVSTNGDNDGCGNYHVRAIDFDFTLNVTSFDSSVLSASAAKALEIADSFAQKPETAPNLGNVHVTFQSDGLKCTWGYTEGTWRAFKPFDANEADCPVR